MKTRKKRRVDPFWPILLIICMAAFGVTFHFAHTYTSEINTKTFETSDKPLLPSMQSIKNQPLKTDKKKPEVQSKSEKD